MAGIRVAGIPIRFAHDVNPALAHAASNVEAPHRRMDLFARRCLLMEDLGSVPWPVALVAPSQSDEIAAPTRADRRVVDWWLGAFVRPRVEA